LFTWLLRRRGQGPHGWPTSGREDPPHRAPSPPRNAPAAPPRSALVTVPQHGDNQFESIDPVPAQPRRPIARAPNRDLASARSARRGLIRRRRA